MNTWLLLITTLPTENATARMRAWRALKASGAAVLRDGVYLLPDHPPCTDALRAVAADVQDNGGSVYLLPLAADGMPPFAGLFDRQQDYAALLAEVTQLRATLTASNADDALKPARKLRKTLAALAAIDFFPGEAQGQAEAAVAELEQQLARLLSPDEPQPAAGTVPRLDEANYQGRLWATRRRPWVDRVASAWLIRRFIDADARFLWLEQPQHCPADALGFDFDGASFSHVGQRVTFEVLLASFGLEQDAGLLRLAAMVHTLDVGGVMVPEAGGFEAMLHGARQRLADDDQLLAEASLMLDSLYAYFCLPQGSPT
ncbi:chromate resistance protein ChrB domain-containing protein [Vogesella sp. LIG4]|uniref:chromate resistance protein ChrB domain-containing protein n=1 Tax=Vogesella sp. LIG4 TaxID=1192162 RepID=UPI00081FEBF6|nr:chromate resistance protein ChrB domain-containing protein [Vogesella sp. LIG4]SCK27615.1 hypothetical protein PSELUDRAFT_3363 [Vogesella sp. LIG4]